jgi:hypothetical protein
MLKKCKHIQEKSYIVDNRKHMRRGKKQADAQTMRVYRSIKIMLGPGDLQ